MKVLIIYDSVFGNTEQIAKAIGSALGSPENIGMIRVSDVKPERLTGLDLLIVGSPTRKFRPTTAITRFLKRIPKDDLKGVRVASFDTRFTMSSIEELRVLPFFVRLFGYAAEPISERLQKKGGKLVIPPEGFFVEDVEGSLKNGELERAADWAKQIRLLEDFA